MGNKIKRDDVCVVIKTHGHANKNTVVHAQESGTVSAWCIIGIEIFANKINPRSPFYLYSLESIPLENLVKIGEI